MGDAAKQYSSSGIEYRWRQQPEAYRETFARNANQITGLITCEWDDAGALKADLMESTEYVKGQGWLKRNPPMLYPDTETLYLTSMVSGKMFTTPQSGITEGYPQFDPVTGLWKFQRIEYVVTFTNLPYRVRQDDEVKSLEVPELNRYVVITPQPIASNRILSSQSIQVEAADGKLIPIQQTAAIPEIVTRYNVKLFMWPKEAIPWEQIYERMGRVNQDEFRLHGITHPPESLLYEGLGSSPEEYTGADGKKYVDVSHVVTRHPVNWNKTFYDGSWRYLRVGKDLFPKRRYEKVTFNEIFKPAP